MEFKGKSQTTKQNK